MIGSAGGIGQPLSMLLKQELMITCLNVYDIAKVNSGVAVDLSHINTTPIVQAYTGADELCTALCGNIQRSLLGISRYDFIKLIHIQYINLTTEDFSV